MELYTYNSFVNENTMGKLTGLFMLYTYNMMSKTLYAYEPIKYDTIVRDIQKDEYYDGSGRSRKMAYDGGVIITLNGEKDYYVSNQYYKVVKSVDASLPNVLEVELLDYYADVQSQQFLDEVHKNCQLMTKRKGLYNYFYDHNTKEELLIALNSYDYHPITNT